MLKYIKTIEPEFKRAIKIYKTNSFSTPYIGVSKIDASRFLLYYFSKKGYEETLEENYPATGGKTESKSMFKYFIRNYC